MRACCNLAKLATSKLQSLLNRGSYWIHKGKTFSQERKKINREQVSKNKFSLIIADFSCIILKLFVSYLWLTQLSNLQNYYSIACSQGTQSIWIQFVKFLLNLQFTRKEGQWGPKIKVFKAKQSFRLFLLRQLVTSVFCKFFFFCTTE